jgi:chemotaxis protein methyltransferase CheR
MMLHEMIPSVHSWEVHIQGSDVSDHAVTRASKGWYSEHELARGLSPERRNKFFFKEGAGYRVTDELRSLVSFERRNLLEHFSSIERYDLVFCRNVAIYFTPQARNDLFHRLATTLTPGGLLFVGSQESLMDLGPRFAPIHVGRATCYRPSLQPA